MLRFEEPQNFDVEIRWTSNFLMVQNQNPFQIASKSEGKHQTKWTNLKIFRLRRANKEKTLKIIDFQILMLKNLTFPEEQKKHWVETSGFPVEKYGYEPVLETSKIKLGNW